MHTSRPPLHLGKGLFYYHNDHLGTPKVLTDEQGLPVWKASHTPFGQAQIETEVLSNNLRFPGQYYDAETGLHYNWHRYYDPSLGRYITSDPIGLTGGINTYGYVYQSPVMYTDHNGLNPAWAARGGWAVGGAISRSPWGRRATAWAVDAAWNALNDGEAEDPLDYSDLQQEIEYEANRRQYHNRCDEPEPPGLTDPCEKAKWKLEKALDCKELRESMTNKWFDGVVDDEHADHMEQINNQIKNAERAVKQNCRDECL